MGLSKQEYWNGLLFLFPVDHILSELSTMTRPSWGALHGMAHSFIELDKAVVPGSGRSPGEGNGNPLQYSCLENAMDRGAWWATVHGVTKIWTWLSNFTHLWSMWSVWLVFCDCVFHSVSPLTDKDKRLMEASWWEGLTVGETGSYSDRWAHRGFPVSSVGK